ncbi:MAG: hypothetical protein ACRDTH_12225 [Pseudonocardiaceae bacterium]
MHSGNITPRLTAVLKDRPDRAPLHSVKRIHHGARQAGENVQAEFVVTGNQRTGPGEYCGGDG